MKAGLTVVLAGTALAGCMTEWRPATPVAGPCAITEQARMRFTGMRFHDTRREAIQRTTNARIARVLRPGDAATMDYRAERLNILIDDNGRISGLRCG